MKGRNMLISALALCLALSGCTPSAPAFDPGENSLPSNAPISTAETPAGEADRAADMHDVLGNSRTKVKKLHASKTGTVYYEDCLYFCDDGAIKKYNVKTKVLSSACTDPGCTHKNAACPLFGVGAEKIDHIDDGVIYWADRGAMFGTTDFYAYDMKTSKKSLIISIPTVGGTGIRHIDYGDWMYLKYPTLKEGGDPEKSSDYTMSVVEINKKTGEKRTAFVLPHASDVLLLALDNGKLLLYENALGYYTINRDGTDKFAFLQEDVDETMSYVVGNKLYFSREVESFPSLLPESCKEKVSVVLDDGMISEKYLPGIGGAAYSNIFCVDIDTGEISTLVSDRVTAAFYISDDYIYCFGWDYRLLEGEHLVGPKKAWGELRAPCTINYTGEIFRVSLSSGEKEKINENCFFFGIDDGILIGDYVYRTIYGAYDLDKNEFNYDDAGKFVRYDLVSNRYDVIPELENRRG